MKKTRIIKKEKLYEGTTQFTDKNQRKRENFTTGMGEKE